MTKKFTKKIAQLLLCSALCSIFTFGNVLAQNPSINDAPLEERKNDEKGTELFEVRGILQTGKDIENTKNPKFFQQAKDQGIWPIMAFILGVINFAMTIIGSLAFLIMVAGSVVMMTSAGNDQRNEQGKNMLTYSIIGLIVAFSAFIITTFVQSLVTGT